MRVPRILLLMHGMGKAEQRDTFAWASHLWPDGQQFESGERRWIDTPDGYRTYLLEIYYEDLNEVIASKYAPAWESILGKEDATLRAKLETYVGDVVHHVLTDGAIDAAQMRVRAKYCEARELSIALTRGTGRLPERVPIAMLSHSLGTLIAFEGLWRMAQVWEHLSYHPVRLVACAPMWSPIRKVQLALKRRRYLATHGISRPVMTLATGLPGALVTHCTALYRSDDPFLLLQDERDYEATGSPDGLIDVYRKVIINPKTLNGHSMTDAYLANPECRALIARGLFP